MGKTTLADLVPRFYDPQMGTVRIDGVDLKEVTDRIDRPLFVEVPLGTLAGVTTGGEEDE